MNGLEGKVSVRKAREEEVEKSSQETERLWVSVLSVRTQTGCDEGVSREVQAKNLSVSARGEGKECDE